MNGPRLRDGTLRRWAWAVFAFYLVVACVDGVVTFADTTPTTEEWGGGGDLGELLFVLALTAFPVVGMLIVNRQPRNRMGWLLLATGLAWTVNGVLDSWARYALVLEPGSLPGGRAAVALSAAFWPVPLGLMGIFLILLFPDGRLPSPRWRPFAWLSGALIAVSFAMFALYPGEVADGLVPGVHNPLGVESLRAVFDAAFPLIILLPVCVLFAACALVQRFRAARGVERLQLKWLATAGAAVAAAYVVAMAVSMPSSFTEGPGSPDPVWVQVLQAGALMSFGLIPVAVGVAMTRYGLYGIDAIISRALVFGALGAFITGVYVAIVVGVGAAIGNRTPSIALSVVATAVVAVAFQPVREAVQRVANRLVYGARATPYEVLSEFASRMAGTYTTGELLPRMSELLGRCLGGARVEVWLVDGSRYVREAAWPPDGDHRLPAAAELGAEDALPVDRRVPVRHQGDLLGLVTVTKPATEPVTPAEDALLGHVASQAGLVLRNVRLIEDLRSSRERLVRSQDHARRRLERNLHDGAQQSLVSVALLLRMTAARLGDDPDGIAPSMAEASAQLQQAIDELRELARGIHPAILTERGLGAAVTALAERTPVPVQVDVALAHRPTATVEGTLYFVVAEALTNITKYAGASTACVTLRQEDDVITAVISDDGVGGADPRNGSGLRGLADRVAAVDGAVEVHSPPGGGTRITCRVPVPAQRAAVLEPVS